MAEPKHWTIDKRIPLAVLIAIIGQTAGAIWWAASVSARIDTVEKWQTANAPIVQKIDRMEERIAGLKESTGRIEQKLDKLIEKRE